MLTFERILEVFAPYLAADADAEVILTRHGYTFMVWDNNRHDWYSVEACETPEELLDALTDSVKTFEEWKLTDGERDPTDAENAAFDKIAETYRQKCLAEQS